MNEKERIDQHLAVALGAASDNLGANAAIELVLESLIVLLNRQQPQLGQQLLALVQQHREAKQDSIPERSHSAFQREVSEWEFRLQHPQG